MNNKSLDSYSYQFALHIRLREVYFIRQAVIAIMGVEDAPRPDSIVSMRSTGAVVLGRNSSLIDAGCLEEYQHG